MTWLVCGLDEVGRGCLAGPIMAVAALFDQRPGPCPIAGVKDSKAYGDPAVRLRVFQHILESPYLIDFGVGEGSVEEIDAQGIDVANQLAFSRAVGSIKQPFNLLIVDGDKPLKDCKVPQSVEPKADAKYWTVSAASVLAKVIRDRMMHEVALLYPQYDLMSNAGYGTPKHISALKAYGSVPGLHRSKFIRKFITREGA